MMTCSTSAGSTRARASAARVAIAPSSLAERSLSLPPWVPAPVLPPTHSVIGVRAPAKITARVASVATSTPSCGRRPAGRRGSTILEHRLALLEEGGHALAVVLGG